MPRRQVMPAVTSGGQDPVMHVGCAATRATQHSDRNERENFICTPSGKGQGTVKLPVRHHVAPQARKRARAREHLARGAKNQRAPQAQSEHACRERATFCCSGGSRAGTSREPTHTRRHCPQRTRPCTARVAAAFPSRRAAARQLPAGVRSAVQLRAAAPQGPRGRAAHLLRSREHRGLCGCKDSGVWRRCRVDSKVSSGDVDLSTSSTSAT